MRRHPAGSSSSSPPRKSVIGLALLKVDEDPSDRDDLVVSVGGRDTHSGDNPLPDDLPQTGRRPDGDVRVCSDLHCKGGSRLEVGRRHEKVHAAGKARQEKALLDRLVGRAGNGDLLVLKEESVAGGAVGDALAKEAFFAWDGPRPRHGTGSDDPRPAAMTSLVHLDRLHFPYGPDAEDPVLVETRPMPLGLTADPLHQLPPRDLSQDAGAVSDPRRASQGPGGQPFVQDERPQRRTGGVEGCRRASRPPR